MSLFFVCFFFLALVFCFGQWNNRTSSKECMGCRRFVGYLWCRWAVSIGIILSFCIWILFLLFTPSICYLLCQKKAAREFKKEGKRQGYLLTQNFISSFTTILWHGTFSSTDRSSRVSQTSCWNILVIFYGKSLKFILCSVVVFSEVFLQAANRTQPAAKSRT